MSEATPQPAAPALVPDSEWVAVPTPGLEAQHSWESQEVQYPATGPPGVTYFAGVVSADTLPVDCLLWRDDDGLLCGILNHYPQDYGLQAKGTANMWVRPGYHGRGIGTALALAARERFPRIDRQLQRYTADGAGFVMAFLARHPRETPRGPE
jgi:GNAT superfamily N-acetyltransferase